MFQLFNIELFCIPVLQGASVSRLADNALAGIYRTPWKHYFLNSIDALCLDELGQIPAHYLSVMDTIMRKLRKSNRFMGGLLLLPSMDQMQLYPVEGMHPLLSSHVIPSFQFLRLQHSVRCGNDSNLKRLNKITRLQKSDLTEEVREEFQILISMCNFVHSFRDPSVPKNATYVFGKKEPGQALLREIVRDIKQNHTHRVVIAEDEQSTRESSWTPATSHTTRRLNRSVKEPQELLLYEGGF